MVRPSKVGNARGGVAMGEGSLIPFQLRPVRCLPCKARGGVEMESGSPFRQDIRFARTADELRIAYAVSGQSYPLVRAATWMSNVEFDIQVAARTSG